jgi:hypothetical protein
MIATCAEPFVRGTSDRGSVAIEASSRNTKGKSITSSMADVAERQVVQMTSALARTSKWTRFLSPYSRPLRALERCCFCSLCRAAECVSTHHAARIILTTKLGILQLLKQPGLLLLDSLHLSPQRVFFKFGLERQIL